MNKYIAISLIGLIPATAASGERMNNDELRSFYTGKTLVVTHFKLGRGRSYFAADGALVSVSDSGKTRVGKWWIDEDRNMRCVRWDNKHKDFCRYTEKNSDGTYTLVRPKDGKRLVEIHSAVDGKQL